MMMADEMREDDRFHAATHELRWPKEVFLQEAGRVASHDAALILIGDAFVDGREMAEGLLQPLMFVQTLVRNPEDIRQRPLRLYWSQRERMDGPTLLGLQQVAARFVGIVEDLSDRGYFEQVFGADCVDKPRTGTDPGEELYRRLGRSDLWPLQETYRSWDRDTLFDLIEVFHDMAARPAVGKYHSFGGCGWDYSAYSASSGKAVYRWEVNQILDLSELGYRIAQAGEGLGRIVAVSGDAREDLVDRMLGQNGPGRSRIDHAINEFRSRRATRDGKRSAIRSLAEVLEERRQLLKAELLRKDEGALFQIANEFDIRHHGANQHSDYDDAYLDWLFWWYLATIELSDRLLARQEYASQ